MDGILAPDLSGLDSGAFGMARRRERVAGQRRPSRLCSNADADISHSRARIALIVDSHGGIVRCLRP